VRGVALVEERVAIRQSDLTGGLVWALRRADGERKQVERAGGDQAGLLDDGAFAAVQKLVSAGIRVFVVLGGVFGTLAALIAALITWGELEHHRLPQRQMLSEVVRIALVTLVVFAIVTLVAGLVLLPLFHVEQYR
jgi:hypothetical protein